MAQCGAIATREPTPAAMLTKAAEDGDLAETRRLLQGGGMGPPPGDVGFGPPPGGGTGSKGERSINAG